MTELVDAEPAKVATLPAAPPAPEAASAGREARSEGVWLLAWQRFRGDRVGLAAGAVVLGFVVLIVASSVGLVAADWQREVGVPNARPAFLAPAPVDSPATALRPSGPNVDLSDVDPLAPAYAEWEARTKDYAKAAPVEAQTLPLGGDWLGRDVLAKAVKGSQISVLVGLLAALVATLIGTVLGALAGFLGRRTGDLLEWLYNVLEAIPSILLIFVLAALLGRGIGTVVLVLALTGWTGLYRQVRAEFLKHGNLEYVRAAEAIGASRWRRMFQHILPNVSHVILVRMGLLVVGFIKAEVILSYLGLGVGVDDVSWGTMLAEAQSELVLGYWWQLAVAATFMAVFVTAFSLLTDAVRDALDPRLRGLS
jgi:oligopeptide transport system permease protein